jgi:hypothetical protein
MTEHWPKSVESVTRRFYCDTCKEGTPHTETSPDVWRCTIPHAGNDGRKPNPPKQNLQFGDYNDTARHFAALDGMGNRGEQPPPIQLRTKEKPQ